MKTWIRALGVAVLVSAAPPSTEAQNDGGGYAVGEAVRPEAAHPPPAGVSDLAWEDLVPKEIKVR